MRKLEDLDSFDRRLLELMQVDSRLTGKQLAEKIGLSPATCLRRLQRLRRIKAIEREVAVLSSKFTEPHVRTLVHLTVARDRPDRIDQLRRKLLRLPQVERVFHVTGDDDFIVIVVCPTMEDYVRFTETHFYAPEIKGFESKVVLREWQRQ